jgi:hypothetical protein
MKRILLLLAMLLMAATSYNQSTDRTNNANQTAPKNRRQTTETRTEKRTPKDQKSSNDNADNERKSTTSSGDRSSGTTTSPAATRRQSNSDSNVENKSVNNYNTTTRTQTNVTENKVERKHGTNHNEVSGTTQNHELYSANHKAITVNKNRIVHTAPVTEYYSPRVYREHHAATHYYYGTPESKRYRERHYIYRQPVNVNVYWTPILHDRFIEIYPMVKFWYYPVNYRIETISSYDADNYLGEVMNVYGRVSEVFYSRSTDEYFLYFGPYYPYQDFTVVIPGGLARNYSPRPSRFFANQNVVITGLITSFEGNPEMVIRDSYQFNLY